MSHQLIELSNEIQAIRQEILETIGKTVDPSMLDSVLEAVCKLIMDATQRSNANPSGQMFRFLQAFYLSGKLTESEFYGLSGKFGQIQLRLDQIADE